MLPTCSLFKLEMHSVCSGVKELGETRAGRVSSGQFSLNSSDLPVVKGLPWPQNRLFAHYALALDLICVTIGIPNDPVPIPNLHDLVFALGSQTLSAGDRLVDDFLDHPNLVSALAVDPMKTSCSWVSRLSHASGR